MKRYSRRILTGVILSICLLMPLMAFQYFYIDYVNHTWLTEYYAQYFKYNLRFPAVIHTQEVVGIAYPQFYGYLFYPVMGFLSLLTGSTKAAYILCSAVSYTMIFLIYSEIFIQMSAKAGIRMKQSDSGVMAFLIICNPYILTNLYSRNAMTEYYALLGMYITVGSWILSFFKEQMEVKWMLWSLSALSFMFMLGSHPITAELGGIVCICMVLVTLPWQFRQIKLKEGIFMFLFGGVEMLLIVLAVSPWLYITVCSISELAVNAGAGIETNIAPFLGSNYLTRLMLFPMDARSLTDGILNVSTPYLDLQMNMPLVILYMVSWVWIIRSGKIIRRQKWAAFVLLLLGVLTLICTSTVSSPALNVIGRIFRHIQFSYRLIGYADLFVVFGILYNFWVLVRSGCFREYEKYFAMILIICVTLGAHNLLIQMTHAYATANQTVVETEPFTNLPATFYGVSGYCDTSIPSIKEDPPEEWLEVNVPVYTDGHTLRTEFKADKKMFVRTNIQSARYNEIYVDGVRLDRDVVMEFDGYLGFYADAGTHVMDYAAEFPYMFLILRKLSYVSVFLLVFLTVFFWIRAFCMHKRGKRPEIPEKKR